jgi:DNA-binding Lrp family transcriptional regulator
MVNNNTKSGSHATTGRIEKIRKNPKGFFVVKKNGKTYHKFFLIKPRENANIDKLANDLIQLKDVVEVYATEGSAGFIVKARFDKGKEPSSVSRYIQKNISKDYGTLISYINFKRGSR